MKQEDSSIALAGRLQAYARESGRLVRIALPLIMASLVNMGMSITDVVMMGWLGPAQLAAGAAVSDYYSLFFYLCAGLVAAISPLIAQARGRQDSGAVRQFTQQGFLLALLLALPGALIVFNTATALSLIGIDDTIIRTGTPYAQVMCLTFGIMLLVSVLHHFLSAHGKTRVIFIITACALPLNALGNQVFMFGVGAIPSLGLAGAGVSSALTATFIFIVMVAYVHRSGLLRRYSLFRGMFHQRLNNLGEIVHLGLPIGISNLGEMGVFLFSTVTMGVFGTDILAAHTVTLRMAGVVFAIPMGFAQAATVRIGLSAGRQDSAALRQVMLTVMAISVLSGIVTLSLLIGFAEDITRAFIGSHVSPIILTNAVSFLMLLAISEPFTHIGCIGAGVLRGLKDTRTTMLFSLSAYWGIGFVGGWALAFVFGYEGLGIWVGLISACMAYGLAVLFRVTTIFGSLRLPMVLQAAEM